MVRLTRLALLLPVASIAACTGSSSDHGKERPRSASSIYSTQTAAAATLQPANTATAVTSSTAQKTPKSGPRYLSVKIDNSLEKALSDALGSDLGTPLSQVATRVLVWWIDMPKDMRRGDKLELVYEPRDNAE